MSDDGLRLYRRDLARHAAQHRGYLAERARVLRRALDLPFTPDFKAAVVNEADRLLGPPRWKRWSAR